MRKPQRLARVLVAVMSFGAASATSQSAISTHGSQETDLQRTPMIATEASTNQAKVAAPPSRLRVGTFDSRFVALAYYRSEHGQKAVRALQEELREARAKKDKKRSRQLEAKGPALQNLMHQQVFGSLSIPNVMEVVSARLPTVAAEAGVSLLVSKWEILYNTPEVERVDLTEQLVELFNLDDDTRRMIDEVRKTGADPIPIEQLLEPHD